MKPKLFLFYLISILFLIAITEANSSAQCEVICFLKDYTRVKGKPITITDAVYSALEGTATLKETTNAKETSGKITLNGQIILMQGDFKEKITYYEKEVTLQQSDNTIEVYDESKPGAWMQVEIVQQIEDMMQGSVPPNYDLEVTVMDYIAEDGTLLTIEAVKGHVLIQFEPSLSLYAAEKLIY